MAALASETAVTAATEDLLRRAATMDESALTRVGEDLVAVSAVLSRDPQVRRLLTDGTAPDEVRTKLARQLFDGKIGEASLALVLVAVAQRWAAGRDLVEGIRRLGRTALFLKAERAQQLDAVEDELFRFGRILAANPELALVLDSAATAPTARVEIVTRLLDGKVNPMTLDLLTSLAGDLGDHSFAHGVSELVEQAAQRQDKIVAVATTALPLTGAESERLQRALTTIYGRSVVVHSVVDAAVAGGVSVRVGAEVIDGSISGRLEDLRARLAR